MSLFHLVYVSSAVSPFSEADLVTLLEHSRRKNAAINVTGMLLYRGGNFMQVLEGEESLVRNVYARVDHDPRHSGLITLMQEPIAARAFSQWTMGFRDLDSVEVKNTPGYNEFLNDNWLGPAMRKKPARSLRLLEVFRSNMK